MHATERNWVTQKVGYVPLPRLHKVRLSRGCGLRQLAREAGVSVNTVRRVEAGFSAQSRVAIAFAEALDADLLELLAPETLSDDEVAELRRVLAGGSPRAFGRGDVEDEEDEHLDAM